ncbi:hypothetical protein [Lignipirellula cremea]|uniref:Uncharacterized protein n=1 Tax=Lignipirellula cremea TaxID=2528010 RepID=A0A518DKS4_9BACT|nr:hypothetical protein [Lignipirellula cremea]QDU92431.1 hypothetical protein Pla8534_01790 [Lignipirellula cremea]
MIVRVAELVVVIATRFSTLAAATAEDVSTNRQPARPRARLTPEVIKK